MGRKHSVPCALAHDATAAGSYRQHRLQFARVEPPISTSDIRVSGLGACINEEDWREV